MPDLRERILGIRRLGLQDSYSICKDTDLSMLLQMQKRGGNR